MNNIDLFISEICSRGYSDVEIKYSKVKTNSYDIYNGYVRNHSVSIPEEYTIRATKNNNTVYYTSTCLESKIIDILDKKLEIQEDKVIETYNSDISNNNILLEKPAENLQPYIDTIKQWTKSNDDRIIEITCMLTARSYHQIIINSSGVHLERDKVYYNLLSSVTAKRLDGSMVSFGDSFYYKNIDLSQMEKDKETVIKETLSQLETSKIESKTYDVIFESDQVISLIYAFISAINLNKVYWKNTRYENKLDIKVFSDKVNIIEDPLYEEALEQRTYDDEGNKTYKKALVLDGVLKTFLSNNRSAARYGMQSTGNAYTSDTSVSNLILLDTGFTTEELKQRLNNGLYITDLMLNDSSCSILEDRITASVSGYIIENGEKTRYFSDAIIDTSFTNIYMNIEEIAKCERAKDLTNFIGDVLVKNINITV